MKLEPVSIMEERLSKIKSEAIQDPSIWLHMGCGPKVLEGFLNIDKYHEHPNVLPVCMSETPFENESVSVIYSSHSLEHLPIRKARLALTHWANILKKGGRLFLAVPDLEFICHAFVSDTVDWNTKWNWLQYTLFGWQTTTELNINTHNLHSPIDPGQFHQCGFSMDYIKDLLTREGLKVKDSFRYDGYDTPSLWVEAEK